MEATAVSSRTLRTPPRPIRSSHPRLHGLLARASLSVYVRVCRLLSRSPSSSHRPLCVVFFPFRKRNDAAARTRGAVTRVYKSRVMTQHVPMGTYI